ncbi:MAG TPA: hypothetical protein VM142_06920 [Acidimicrobiales bacterium]|nr:hypothetical protein [Acidimicrobiales bacterium]
MGKASSSKKVARAASTGGGRTSRGARPWGWYLAMGLVAVLGVVTIVFSRNERQQVASARPTIRDHWHTAYGFYNCTKFEPQLPQPPTLIGLHTHNDGLVHIEPQNSQDTGKGATLGRFVTGQPGFKLETGKMSYPGTKPVKDGGKCGEKKATLQMWVWDDGNDEKGRVVPGDPRKVRIRDNMLLTMAFVPAGTEVPKPPSVGNLKNPNANESGQGGSTPPASTSISIPTDPGVLPGGVPAPGGSIPSGSTPPASDAPASDAPASSSPAAPPSEPPATPAP